MTEIADGDDNVVEEDDIDVQVNRKPKLDLPPLPYSNFELESNLITVLADLDHMINAEMWEEETFNQMDKKLTDMRENGRAVLMKRRESGKYKKQPITISSTYL